jgi:hypothetical protein
MGEGAARRQTHAGAEADKTLRDRESSAFSRHVSQLLERIEYRRCETGEDLEDIYRLRYNSYVAAGMIKADASRRIQDEFDDTPNAFRFGIFYDGHLVSTLRLHHVTAECPISPSVKVFSDILMSRLQGGESFVDPSRFAADHEWSSTLRVVPYVTLRLAIIACQYFKPTACLTAIKEEHSAFYNRIFRSEQATVARYYPGLTVPVNLMQSKCADNLEATIRRFPFFDSTQMEQRMLFDRVQQGKPASLTVIPTAKYSRAAA